MELKANASGLSQPILKRYQSLFESFDENQSHNPDDMWILIDHELEEVQLCDAAVSVLEMPSTLSLEAFSQHFTPKNKITDQALFRAGSEFRYASPSSTVLQFNVWGYQPDPAQSVRLLYLRKVDQHEPNKLSPLEEQLFSQRHLFSIISHELRTPTATMKMLVDDLSEGTCSAEHIEQMKQTTEHLLYVLEDINQAVNPSRSLPHTVTRFHPNRLLENVHAQMRRLAEISDIKLTLNLIDNEQLLIECDAQRLKIIVLNLIKNAILHSRGTCIDINAQWIKSKQGEGSLVLSVSDDGRGIPISEYSNVFKPFERLGTRVDGSGLGLFLVRQTLDELGGSILVKKSEQGGAQFDVTLPSKNLQFESSHPHLPSAEKDTETRLKSLRLLVVEDDPVIRMVSQRLLGKVVQRVDVAENGQTGLEKAISQQYDLILTDFFMPVMDGLQMIKKIREQGINTPIVSVTAAVLGQESEQLLSAGASHVIAKPISMAAFINIINTLNLG